MSDKKYVVPRGMQIAFVEAMQKRFGGVPGGTAVGLEAAIRWLAENPVVPTDEQVEEMKDKLVPVHPHWANIVAEWQRRMFLAPEPEVPAAVKDLTWTISGDKEDHEHNSAVIEAYNRGKSGK